MLVLDNLAKMDIPIKLSYIDLNSPWLPILLHHKISNRDELHRHNYGDADIELGMLCFVAEDLHTGIASNAATYESHTQQGLFRDSPKIFSGFVFVNQHKQKAQGIDYKEIDDQ